MDLQTLSLVVSGAAFLALMLVERWRPARRLPRVPGWTVRALAISAVAYGLSLVFASFFDGLLGPRPLIDASGLGVLPGMLLGALFLELVNTLWHISLHRHDRLWRWLHQMHHSTERLDVFSALYFSPMDVVGWAAAASFALTFVLGLSVPATVGAATCLFVLNLFSHSNLRTPRWLGYFIVRPEMHALHHERGVHRRNYAVLPVLDMLLGTYENPERFPAATGFHEGASERVVAMLLGRDVTRP